MSKINLCITICIISILIFVSSISNISEYVCRDSYFKYLDNSIKDIDNEICKLKQIDKNLINNFNRICEYSEKLRKVNYRLSKKKAFKYACYISEYSKKYDIEANLVIAFITIESSARSNITSHKGAVGLMQVLPSIWCKEYSVSREELFNPKINIKIGILVLKRYIKKHKNIMKAIAAYNCGNCEGCYEY